MQTSSEEVKSLSPIKRALWALQEMEAKLKRYESAMREPIAVIGLACRFPYAQTPDAFWQLLREGVDAVREVPRERFDVDAYYDSDPDRPNKMYTRFGAFIKGVDQFDPQFFGISPREALELDPQQRLLLEVSWEALERAGVAVERLANTRTGGFIGIGENGYAFQMNSGDLMGRTAYGINCVTSFSVNLSAVLPSSFILNRMFSIVFNAEMRQSKHPIPVIKSLPHLNNCDRNGSLCFNRPQLLNV